MKEEPKDFDEGEGGVGEGDEGDDADGVGQVLLILIHSYLTRRIVLFFATLFCCRMTLEITTAVTLDQKEKISMDRWRPNPSFFEEGNLVYWCSCI